MNPFTLLVVDDEPANLAVLNDLLRTDYNVVACKSGPQALDIAARDPAPELILLDIMMPGMDGFEVLETLRKTEKGRDIPVIFITALDASVDEQRGLDLGAVDYVTKPVKPAVLKARIKTHLELKKNRDLLARQNQLLEKRVQERTRELEEANRALNEANEQLRQNFLVSIKVFSSLMELREGSVAGHARRVAAEAKKLAAAMGLNPPEQQNIFIAALLHDIGKIGFSDGMFSKPRKRMTTEERLTYRKHPRLGAAAIMPVPQLNSVADIISSHHECFDGKGFPNRQAGDTIPLGARIIAVTNDFDGLKTGLLTGRKCAKEEAVKVLISQKHKRYDPKVVDCFLQMMEEKKASLSMSLEKEISVEKLSEGMVLAQDIVREDGTLLLAADYVLDERLILWIQQYVKKGNLSLTVRVRTETKA